MGIFQRTYSTKIINSFSNGIAEKVYKRVGKYQKNIPKAPRAKAIKWTDEQNNVLNHIASGHSVFITGSAGAGKTVLLKQIIKMLNKTYGKSQVPVTASTGIAARAIRGQTLHSFAGIGLGDGDKDMLVDQVLNNKKAYRRWINAEVLVIDEISLINGDLFDKLEHIAKTVRKSNKVWGGIRLVACGDFFQLPPVLTKYDPFCKEFAFEADCWDQSFDIQLELTRIFRQSDEKLIKILQGIRKGKSDLEDLQFVEQLCSELEPDTSVLRLYPRTNDANKVNEERMKALSEKKFVYEAVDESENPWKRLDFGLAPDKLELCKGSRVMLIKNLHVWRGLVNGATGTVTGFTKSEGGTALNSDNPLPILKFDRGPEMVIKPKTFYVMEGSTCVASRLQLPLVYAWAMTIHKCQGMTLDRVHTDLSRAFGCGMVYVALSRVRSLDSLHLSGFSPSKIEAHPKVLEFYNRFACKQETEDGNAVATNKSKNGSNKLLSVSDKTSDEKTGFKFTLLVIWGRIDTKIRRIMGTKMMGMKFSVNAVSVCRTYSTKIINSFSNGIAEKVYKRVGKYPKNIPKAPMAKVVKWTDEQNNVLNHIASGHSVFITGSAGTGKTVLLKQIIKMLNKTYRKSQVPVTASTGIAACAIRGQTLHSFAGIGLGDGDKDMLVDQVLNNKKAYRRWINAEVLVIDEISLINGDLFDKLEHIAKTVRESDKVWGGIRLVACGDFFQLPPVLTKHDPFCKEFAFEADCWDQSFDNQFELTRIFRQSDERLIKILQGIRKGKSDLEDLQFLEQLCSESEPDASVLRLYPRTNDANKVNEERMKALSETKFVYEAVDESENPWKRLDFGLAPVKIELCKGSRVMLIKNLHVWRGLVNGATGIVTGFTKPEGGTVLNSDNPLPILKFDRGPEMVIKPETFHVMEGSTCVASRLQLPLVYAWAMTIHKCQGMTLDRVHTDLSRAFGCGMVYVALSRVRSLDGLHLSGFSPSKIEAHPKVLEFYNRFARKQETDDGNDVATNKSKNGSNKLLSVSDKASDEKTGFKVSLKEFLSWFKWK